MRARARARAFTHVALAGCSNGRPCCAETSDGVAILEQKEENRRETD
jgi:hypothetical protein